MKHTSIKLDSPVEFINITPCNPLISKCQIKVCYVGDEPNRNHSVITKEVAKEMANSLPGSPIVGFYNEANQDFEEHNRVIDISNGKFEIKDTTKPYGFVDLNAKPWFQKFFDDGNTEHEYLMVDGYLWTGQYPECQRVISLGNNQSMELDEKTLDATWSKNNNGKPEFFIINEAIISKLCILGDDCEPCFEGSRITNVQFSFEDGFKQQMFSMMNELKELISNKGGTEVFERYAVEIGDALWNALYSYIEQTYPDGEDQYCSIYRIEGIFEEGEQKFAILQHRNDMKYYRMDFSLSETGITATNGLVEVTKTYVPAAEPQFALDAVDAFIANYIAEHKAPVEPAQPAEPVVEPTQYTADPAAPQEPSADPIVEPVQYNLEEIQEYVELKQQYSTLETQFNELSEEKNKLESELAKLSEFKKVTERKDKEAMIASFNMLTDEDKADVINNIDTYSLEDIKSKLAVICFDNKVNFSLNDEPQQPQNNGVVFNLNNTNPEDSVPAWVKKVREVEKEMN